VEYFPLFADLRERRVVVVGGGSVAGRKIELLLCAGARVVVVSPVVVPSVRDRAERGDVDLVPAAFRPEHLAGAALVIAATDDPRVNAAVSTAARARGLWVNAVDERALSNFIVPSIVDRSPLLVAVSSGGASPMLAQRVRARIEALLPAGLGRLAELARGWRTRLRARLVPGRERRRFWDWFFASAAAQAALDRGGSVDALDFDRALAQFQAARGPRRGMVYLVGAGPGDPDLLTLKALEALGRADVILHDRLVSPEVLARGRRDAERIYVGKQGYGPRVSQEETTALLIALARAGKTVVRLKGGDPFIFGRGGEELIELAAEGIPVQVVPGITAALGCAAAAQIPLTYRGIARTVTFTTARTGAGTTAESPLSAENGETRVIYMGGRQLSALTAQLREHGLPEDTPAAVVVDGTLPSGQVVFGTLATVASRAASLPPDAPALLLVGAAVGVGERIAAMTRSGDGYGIGPRKPTAAAVA
jgi:uroporphyrin-III C-methyltransferase/precorrin-2 dehydrogenase/sirohydrochlorin ferrochelatase